MAEYNIGRTASRICESRQNGAGLPYFRNMWRRLPQTPFFLSATSVRVWLLRSEKGFYFSELMVCSKELSLTPGKWEYKETRGFSDKRKDALVINCTRGEEILEKLGMRRDTTVGALYDKYNVTSWTKVLEKVLG